MEQTQNKKISFLCITMIIFLTCLLSVGTGAVTVKADTKYTVEEVAESIVFITFKKGVTEERGNYLCASFFFPEEYFEDEYEYGVAVFPENYITKYELYGNYIARKDAEGIAIYVIMGSGGRHENGRLCNYTILHIPDKGLSMRIAYVIFVRNSEGDIAYKKPVISSFEETILENVSTDELLSMAKERQKEIEADRNFKNITDKIFELVDSIWIYLVIGCSAVVVIWGAYIGIRLAVSKRNEQKADAQGMVKRLVIGIVIMFVLAGALPLLIKGLALWIGG